MKRIFDLLFSTIFIIILLPIYIALALIVKLQDGGPSLFSQQRVGKDGRIFRIWKFRSMIKNAERIGGYSTLDGDPRITPFGHFLRRSSIDELPQLYNVLIGDMSLVGPRPDVPAQSSLYTNKEWSLRQSVRPGITGLAQATLRSKATHAQRIQLDLQYVNNLSFIGDLQIILMTIKQVIQKGGN